MQEVPYYRTPANSPDTPSRYYGHEKGDIDVALVDIDNEIIRAFEVKSSMRHLAKGKEQMEKLAKSVSNIRQNVSDFNWDITGNVVLAEDIHENYTNPEEFSGNYYFPVESMRKAATSESYFQLYDHLFDERLRPGSSEMITEL